MEQFYSSLLAIASHGDDVVAIMHHSRLHTGSLHGGKRFHPVIPCQSSDFLCGATSHPSSDSSEEIVDDDESRVDVGTFRMLVPLVPIQSVAVNSLGVIADDVSDCIVHHGSSSVHSLGGSLAIAPFQRELRGEIVTDDSCLQTTPPGVGVARGGTTLRAPAVTMATTLATSGIKICRPKTIIE